MKTSNIGESRLLHVPLSVAVIVALLVVDSGAAELTITNQSFENPVLPDGGVVLSVPGWTAQGTIQIYNPNNSFFLETTDGSPNSPLDGLNASAVNDGGKLTYQSANLVSPQVVYSLTFLAGHRIGVPFGAGSVSFWAGTNLLAERFPSPTLSEGTFAPFSLIYTSPPSGPVIGMPLRIELKATGANSQAWFDNLRLFAMNSGAAELTITNHSFENPVLTDGGFVLSVPGWTGQGTVTIYNPDNSFFFNATDGSPNSPLDGLNAAGVNNGGKLSYQSTNLVFPQVVYSLTFLAGHRLGGNQFGNSSVSLWAGTNLLAERFPTPTLGTFSPFSLNYTSPPSGPAIGMPLRIELKAAGTDSQPWFDNLHLFANPSICTPHKATATAQVVNGFFVGATITDPGCGYTNAPLVLIQGGGGNGAVATAIVTNGRVVEIRVTSVGCCYTTVPTLVIGSPPFVPTVGIRLSKIMVTQNVVLGRNYVLESSFDVESWTPTGPSFTATSETIESEFDLSLTGRFFRLREVP